MAVTAVTDSFYEITGRKLINTSFLRLFNILQDHDGTKFLNIFRTFALNDDITEDIIYYDSFETETGNWWEDISYKYYGTPHLWWVICLMNNITNPFEELNPGSSLKILKDRYLYALLKDIERLGDL